MAALPVLAGTARVSYMTALSLLLQMDSVPCQSLLELEAASSRLALLLTCLSTWGLSEDSMVLLLAPMVVSDTILVD